MDDLSEFIIILHDYYTPRTRSSNPCPFIKWAERHNRIICSIIQYIESNNKK